MARVLESVDVYSKKGLGIVGRPLVVGMAGAAATGFTMSYLGKEITATALVVGGVVSAVVVEGVMYIWGESTEEKALRLITETGVAVKKIQNPNAETEKAIVQALRDAASAGQDFLEDRSKKKAAA